MNAGFPLCCKLNSDWAYLNPRDAALRRRSPRSTGLNACSMTCESQLRIAPLNCGADGAARHPSEVILPNSRSRISLQPPNDAGFIQIIGGHFHFDAVTHG